MKKTPGTVFTCQNCGHQSGKWLGKCPECGEWNSLVEERAPTVRRGGARNGFKLREVAAVAYDEIASQDDVRVLIIEGEAFKTILKDRPEVAISVLRHMSTRVRQLNQQAAIPPAGG